MKGAVLGGKTFAKSLSIGLSAMLLASQSSAFSSSVMILMASDITADKLLTDAPPIS
jgi:hypothetical protein